jgi:hypothetical protein
MWGNFARMSGAEVAQELAGAISRFEERSESVISAARSDLVSTTQFLEDRRRVWQEELARRQEALNICQMTVTEEGPPDCSGYAAARDEAQANVDTLLLILRRVEDAGSAFEAGAGQFQSELASTCPAARAELNRLSGVVGWYEA